MYYINYNGEKEFSYFSLQQNLTDWISPISNEKMVNFATYFIVFNIQLYNGGVDNINLIKLNMALYILMEVTLRVSQRCPSPVCPCLDEPRSRSSLWPHTDAAGCPVDCWDRAQVRGMQTPAGICAQSGQKPATLGTVLPRSV